MQFKLWHARNSRSLRVLWTFEECGLRRGHGYQLVALPFPPRVHAPSFLRTNPLGTVPWFEHFAADRAAPRAAMSESCAVPLYVVEQLRSPLLVDSSEPERGAFLNWLFHADATLTFPQSITMRYGFYEPGRADAAAEDYAKWYLARLRLLSAHLEGGRDYLCGDRFTVADICITFALFNASEHGLLGSMLAASGREPLCVRYKPQVSAYMARMIARPSWRAAQEEQSKAEAEQHANELVDA
ncbi:hypothetical protein AB1Y20_010116 [Prymnesium parvum]|uniref:GST C-terminal domain-containing protein n=1 Tax=Prymnesium parvum TaxID=97485 RepID=A0AB34K716_PRYPA